MRIYAVADIHGKKEKIQTICSVSRAFKPDLIVIAGDITNYFSWKPAIGQLDVLGQKDKSGQLHQQSKINPLIFCIRGNSDFKQLEHNPGKSKNLKFLDALPFYFQGIPFMGTNGTIPLPFASRICMGENSLLKTLLPHVNEETILVTHPPPRGVCDKVGNRFRAGSQNLFDFISKTQPRMVLCGHIHEQAGTGFIKNTLVVNCAMNPKNFGAIIDLKKGSPPKVNLLQAENSNDMEASVK